MTTITSGSANEFRIKGVNGKTVDSVQNITKDKTKFKTDDYDNAINKIAYVLPYCSNTEFVIIIIPFGTTSQQIKKNPDINSIIDQIHILAIVVINNNINAIQWYKITSRIHLNVMMKN
ncbi:hypothetical protein Glove_359g18 [Diversispora epigaea]|uniref:Uncharacterized protein n=1 Tax=Diversispora epigaea TaxID=1348612 RepID=A0A397HDG0_9GLOM|nr:hypothetical protein Glove_359g18 [Diversispora epigaea]